MSANEVEETRSLVLGYLAKRRKESREQRGVRKDVTREEMLKSLKIDETVLDYHMKELAEQYLVYVQISMPHMPWTHAHITSRGAKQAEE